MSFFLWFLVYFTVFVSGLDDLDLRFLTEFTSHYTFYSNAYTLIACREIESINLIKMFSRNLGRFVGVHEAGNGLRQFDEEPQTFLLNIGCSEAEEILQQAERLNLFVKPFQWLLFGKETRSGGNFSEVEETSLWSLLETLSILPDSDLKMVERNAEGKFSVTGAYKVSNLGSLIREPLAEWTPEGGLVVFNPKVTAIRRWNLQGLVLPSSVVLTHDDSLRHLDDFVDKHIDTTTKVVYNCIKLFEDLHNIRLTFKRDTEWGTFRNGSWSGMVGRLERKEIELAGAPLFLQKERLSLLEYYACLTPTRWKFLFLSPPISYSKNMFALPFDSAVWCCCCVTVAVSCFFIYVALRVEISHSDRTETHRDVSFTEVLLLNIGIICLQGTVAVTKDPPGRIITFFCYISYMFLYISYSAAIVAILQSPDTSIRTLQDFMKSPLPGGADDVVYSKYYFQNVQEELRRTIYLQKIAPKGEPEHFYSPEEGIRRVQEGFYAYHVEVTTGYQIIQRIFTEEEKCYLREIEENYFETDGPWSSIRRKSPYGEIFKIGIKRIIERGLKNRIVRRYFTEKPVCQAKSSRFMSVGVNDCYYACLVLIWGVGLSIIILIGELSFSGYKKGQNETRTIKSVSYPGFLN